MAQLVSCLPIPPLPSILRNNPASEKNLSQATSAATHIPAMEWKQSSSNGSSNVPAGSSNEMEAECCLRIPARLFKRDGAYVPSPFLFCPFCSERQMWQLELLQLFWTMTWLWAGTHRTEQYIGHWVSGDHRVTAPDYTRLPTSGLLPGERTHPRVCRPLFLSPWLLATKCNYWLILEEAIILCIRQCKFHNFRL